MGGTVSRPEENSDAATEISERANTDNDNAGDGAETPPSVLDPAGRVGSSLGSIVPTIFTWTHGGHTVYVTGAWDSWSVKVPLTRAGVEHTAVLSLPVGSYQYKFIVDGNWKHSPSLPTETDQHGNLNNIVSVAPHLPEYDSNLPPVGANEPPSPVESYDFSMPSNGDYTAEPMVMPSLFKISTLDDNISEQKEKSNPSGYVCLNHLFDVGSSSPTDPIKTMATVQRYKVDKFITTVMIVNAAMPTSGPISVPVATRHQELDIPVGNSVGSDPDVGITPGRPTPADLAVSPRMGAHS